MTLGCKVMSKWSDLDVHVWNIKWCKDDVYNHSLIETSIYFSDVNNSTYKWYQNDYILIFIIYSYSYASVSLWHQNDFKMIFIIYSYSYVSVGMWHQNDVKMSQINIASLNWHCNVILISLLYMTRLLVTRWVKLSLNFDSQSRVYM